MSDLISYISAADFQQEVLESSLPVAVDFYSEDCPPCAQLAPIYEKLAQKYGSKMKFVKILRQANRELALQLGVKSSPTVLFFQNGKEIGSRFTGYIKKAELRQAVEKILGIDETNRDMTVEECDVLILGGGPAGLTAGIYTGRAKLKTIIVDEGLAGGQAATTYHIANYPGTGEVVRGNELMAKMAEQARSFGVRIEELKEVSEVDLNGPVKRIQTEDVVYYAKSVIIATGAEPRKLPAEGEDLFRGRGVHYCATCDGIMYEGKHVVVVGGGNSAVEEAVYLTRFADKITIIHEFDHFQASKTAQEEAFKNPKIDIIWGAHVKKVLGEGHLQGVVYQDLASGEMHELAADGVFVYIGTQPRTGLFKEQLDLNQYGYIKTDEEMQTAIPGVFAAGDVRVKGVRQVITACGDGCIAALSAEKYLAQ
ncbi:thioredoxin-disulfide reductase [Zhaonella formicivorans]|uniref:thioredoxin-disulfide reductase n=1 Tax=Zhaonella formicivorans TaxID=2528593 RepID=UPI0010EFC637|nr:thioredoxin-disulfide reductase [Zhaonella formicivorans]